LQREVDCYLAELHFSHDGRTEGLGEAMRYSLLAGGKRIRPVLSLATAKALDKPSHEVLPLAAAIELIHTYSLIHDDLPAMDDDTLRRGRPTCHVAYGEDVAILAGDGLFAEALSLVLTRQQGDPPRILSALRALVSAAGVDGMVGGQYLDVTGSGARDASGLRHLHTLKTGRLIATSVESVLVLYGGSERATIALRQFAGEVGVLFQIVDDILDVTGDEQHLGKPHGSDQRHGKLTYVSLFGLDEARQLAAESHRRSRAALAQADSKTAQLEQVTDYILRRQT
jgi:geranylgeranyl diphosphate synthase, type II